MITITRRLEFCAGHRVLGHEGHCRFLHGHHYIAEITVQSESGLDSLGRVIDFSVIKSRVGKWIDEIWDHNILLHPDDPQLLHFQMTEDRLPYVMELKKAKRNPTAENIAEDLCLQAIHLLPELQVTNVRIWETPNCFADYSNDASV